MSNAVVACITARNEADNICALVQGLKAKSYGVLVVDDGSTDGTASVARYAGAQVWRHWPAEGISWSQRQAWSVALAQGAQVILQLDAGESHSPTEANELIKALDPADIIIGSRFALRGSYVGGPRQYLSRLATAMCNSRFRQHLTDWTSGYRAFSAAAALQLLGHGYRAKMHGWQIEVLLRAIQDGLRIEEVPITYRAGRSSLNPRAMWEAFSIWAHG